ncbi:hypothetical protein ACWGE1_30900 [Streptomyces sp. NPDC054932]
MTSNALTSQALTAPPGPAWIHLIVIVCALLFLVRTLSRHR